MNILLSPLYVAADLGEIEKNYFLPQSKSL